jgi:DoxX-like family
VVEPVVSTDVVAARPAQSRRMEQTITTSEEVMSHSPALDRTGAPRRVGPIVVWSVQVLLALAFVGAAWPKISSDPAMVDTFARIGAGQWLRYLTGTLELAGAVGLLIPRLCGLAALCLSALLVGAAFTDVAVLHDSPLVALCFLLVSAVVARARWTRTVALVQR